MRYWTGNKITKLEPNYIFVYGANPEFRNGAGAAKDARKFGALPYGGGRGIVGQTYGLVTKNLKAGFVEHTASGDIVYDRAGRCSVSLTMITENIKELYDCCNNNLDKKFFVAYQNGNSNLNGYSSKQIFECFLKAGDMPENIYFHESFKENK